MGSAGWNAGKEEGEAMNAITLATKKSPVKQAPVS